VSSYFFRGLFNDAIRMTDSTVSNVRLNIEIKNWKGFGKQGCRLIEILSRDLLWGGVGGWGWSKQRNTSA
jgi:hypothetical protein